MKQLPYRTRTATGTVLDIEFRLHADAGDAVFVAPLVSASLAAVDRELALAGPARNGDVLQVPAMASAIRAGMIHAAQGTTTRLAHALPQHATEAVARARRAAPAAGHA